MSTINNIQNQSRKDPAQLEREIDQQRNHVEDLIEAIQSKLSPGEIVDKFFGSSKDGGRQFASNLSHTVRANPVPTLLTAAGMLWLYAQKDRPVEPDYADYEDGDETSLRDRAADGFDTVKHGAGSAAHGVSSATRRGARKVSRGFNHMLDDNPIALGAMGIAAGALIGALLPTTDVEDEHLGKVRDRLADKAREKAEKLTQPPPTAGNGSDNATPRFNA